MKLDGKTALITGGGTGLGAAIAKRFVADGARVCIVGRRRYKLEETAASLPEGSIMICPGDVSKSEDVKRMVAVTLEFGGRLDILVNNAAVNSKGGVIELDLDEWRTVVEIDLTGPFLLMKESIPHMISRGGGSIINIASLGGLRSMPKSPVYASSKAGLIMLTKQVALDYGPQRVRCNVICPGAFKTDMLSNEIAMLAHKLGTDDATAFSLFSQNVPLRRVARPDEITGLCSYLASDDASFMTGSILVIDGGAAIVDISGAAVSNAGL